MNEQPERPHEDSSQDEQPAMTRRERRELKEQKKEQERLGKEKQFAMKEKRKSILIWSSVAVLVVLLGYATFSLSSSGGKEQPDYSDPYSKGQVHWHAVLRVFVCGEEKLMPAPIGESHLGQPLLHTHEDRRIHIEGVVQRPEEITLGKYMTVIGQTFKDDELLEKKNGDLCDGKPGKVKLLVDEKESADLTQHVIKDGESYELRFEA